ncbi:MAG: RNA pyrophosphohydrolase [Sandaracinobacteroides sp.]
MSDLPYRPGVGIMLVNRANNVFVGQRFDAVVEAWQMPQGGIDPGEDPYAAALRELEEETGVVAQLTSPIAETADWLSYDLPPELQRTIWKGRYRGQRQKWYALRFHGTDADVDLMAHAEAGHAEFKAWQWASLDTLADLIVPFKRVLYGQLVAELGPRLG